MRILRSVRNKAVFCVEISCKKKFSHPQPEISQKKRVFFRKLNDSNSHKFLLNLKKSSELRFRFSFSSFLPFEAGYKIPKGAFVALQIYFIHRDER